MQSNTVQCNALRASLDNMEYNPMHPNANKCSLLQCNKKPSDNLTLWSKIVAKSYKSMGRNLIGLGAILRRLVLLEHLAVLKTGLIEVWVQEPGEALLTTESEVSRTPSIVHLLQVNTLQCTVFTCWGIWGRTPIKMHRRHLPCTYKPWHLRAALVIGQ